MPKKFGLYSRSEKALIHKVGTRGVCLLILSTMWLLLGFSFLTHPIERFSKPGSGGILDFLDKGPMVYIFAGIWVIGAATGIVVTFQRPITCKDGLGFNGVGLPPFLWGAAYWWSFLLNSISDGEFGRPNTQLAGILYWTMTLLVMFLSRHLCDHPDGPCARRRANSGSLSQ